MFTPLCSHTLLRFRWVELWHSLKRVVGYYLDTEKTRLAENKKARNRHSN